MNKIIRTFFLSYLIFNLALGPVAADTASLLPNAVQQFFDNNGNPLTSGKVYTYDAGTSTFRTTWKDSAETLVNTNPITLDAGGKAIIYGSGTYRQLVKDRNGNIIWDAVTAPGGGGSTPTLVGDGNLVGTVLPWSGLIAPNQYVFAYGQEIARATYSVLFTAITQQLNVICSAASNILTGISDTSSIKIGSPVELPLCVPVGTTVIAKTAATVTLSNPSSVSINSAATFFPWGNGNGSTTFNVPDFRGVVLAGRTNMGGTASTNLTSAFFTATKNISPEALGAVGGSQSHTITISESAILSYNSISTVTDPGHIHGLNMAASGSGGGGLPNQGGTVIVNVAFTNIVSAATGISVNTIISANAGGQPHSIIQPTTTINYIVKILPDTSTSIATGVFSIGGMTGVISCGSGILCTGNIISSNGSPGGNDTNVQYNSNNALAGSPNFIFISPDNLTLGSVGFTGKFDIFGFTSGRVRQTASAIAGTTNIQWGNTSGTPAVIASSPLFISSTTGNLTISPDALTRVNDTNVTLTLGGGPNTATISPVSLTLGWSGTLAFTRGGFGFGSAISGGIPFFNSTTTVSASNLLTANQIMIGGGAGVAPSTFACATSTTVVHGGTPPTCGQIVNNDITTNTISNNSLAQVAAVTLKGNPTSGTANDTDFAFAGLTQTLSPNATDMMLIWDSVSNTFKKITTTTIATSSVAGVASLNGLAGALTLNASNGLNIVSSGATISITADIATTANFEAGTANKILDSNVVFTPETVVTFGTTTVLSFNNFINAAVTLTNNTTLSCNNIKAGQAGTISFIQDSTGTRVITPNSAAGWCSQFRFPSATIPTLTTSASAVDILAYSCRSTTYCAAALNKGFNP